jgi:hypothetical protein
LQPICQLRSELSWHYVESTYTSADSLTSSAHRTTNRAICCSGTEVFPTRFAHQCRPDDSEMPIFNGLLDGVAARDAMQE